VFNTVVLAVNCYVQPVYTLDADIVVIAATLPDLTAHLDGQGFKPGCTLTR
jgi:hypothetical protein